MYNICMLYAKGVLIGLLILAAISLLKSISEYLIASKYPRVIAGPHDSINVIRATSDEYWGWFVHLILIGFIISAIVSL